MVISNLLSCGSQLTTSLRTKDHYGTNIPMYACRISVPSYPNTPVCDVQHEPVFIRLEDHSPILQVPARLVKQHVMRRLYIHISETLNHRPWPHTCISESILQCTRLHLSSVCNVSISPVLSFLCHAMTSRHILSCPQRYSFGDAPLPICC